MRLVIRVEKQESGMEITVLCVSLIGKHIICFRSKEIICHPKTFTSKKDSHGLH